MKISVIIPVYNEAPFLHRCLDSIPECQDVEVILIDDGSTDGSGKICDSYKDKFKVVHQKNGGVSVARNHGLNLATGDYVTFLDADDQYLRNSFHVMFDAIEKAPRENIIQFNHYRHYTNPEMTIMKYANVEGFYRFDIRPEQWCMVWNKLYRRSFIEENHFRFKVGLQYGEDEIFNLHCIFKNLDVWCDANPIMTRNLDNGASLSHTISMEKLQAQDDALYELLNETTEPLFRVEIKELLASHHSSRTYQSMGWKEKA